MGQTKDISKDLGRRVVAVHQGCKRVSREFGHFCHTQIFQTGLFTTTNKIISSHFTNVSEMYFPATVMTSEAGLV